jgi:hypothetical protein
LESGKTGVRYEKPREGGRKRQDGEELKWKVIWPVVGGSLGIQRGELPFFCHDVTDRSLRGSVGRGKYETSHVWVWD